MAALVILLGLLLFGLPLYGPRLINQLPGDYRIQARSVGGPLWRPVLRGALIDGSGIRAEADELELRITAFNPFTRELRFTGRLKDAEIDLDLKQLFSGQRRNNWQFVPQDFALENVRVNLDNSGYSLPDARLSARGENGRLNVQAITRHGGAKADIRYVPRGGQLTGEADVQFDATLVNAFWPGVRGGKLTGRYTFDGGALQGDLTVVGGRIVVPGVPLVEIEDIGGTVQHRGSSYDIALKGEAWDGPVSARARVNTAARRWTASGEASPSLAGLARELGTTGQGNVRVMATAEGWDQPVVSARVTGQGELASVPFEALQAGYTLENRQSSLQGAVRTRLQGETQQLQANWTVGGEGRATATGMLLDAPLNLGASLQGARLNVSGRALRGPISAVYNLQTRNLRAFADVNASGVELRAALRGPLSNLDLSVERLSAAGLELRGKGQVTETGVSLDLGALSAQLDRQGQGTWRADALAAYGVTVDGNGRVDLRRSSLTGVLDARLPAVEGLLSGALDVNWRERRGQWDFGRGTARWRGEGIALALRGVRVAGLTTQGDLTYAPGSLLGEVDAIGDLGTLRLRGRGTTALLDARVRGVRILGETRLGEDYRTTVRLDGADLSGDVRLSEGVQFDLRSGDERLRGTARDGQVRATGALDLRALRALAGAPDLDGRLVVDMNGNSGTGSLQAQLRGAQIRATFQADSGNVRSNVDARYGELRAILRGQAYPRVDVNGTLAWQGQQVLTRLSGTPGNLSWTANGTSEALNLAGVVLPAQNLRASGQLTPQLSGTARWGELDLTYADGRVRVAGDQRLTVRGESASVQLNGELGPDWTGAVRASGRVGPYDLRASGPWRALQFSVSGTGLRGTGSLDAATLAYQAQLRGRISGVFVDGRLRGQRDRWRASGRAADGVGGFATFDASSPTNFRARFNDLTAMGQRLQGELSGSGAALNGTLRVGDLRLTARQGELSLGGDIAGTALNGRARLQLPTELNEVRLSARGPWGNVLLTGSARDLRGRLNLSAQETRILETPLSLPGATLPVRASLVPPRVQVGGLGFAGGVLGGAQNLTYRLGTERGQLRLTGNGTSLRTSMSGPVQGNVQVYPTLSGEVRAGLTPLVRALPEVMRRELQPGQLRARLLNSTASLDLLDTRYVGLPLELDARLDWQRSLRAEGELRQPGTRLPFSFSRRTLDVRGARLDALALRPLVNARGAITGNLHLPDLDLERAQARVNIDLRSGEQAARGTVTLAQGQLRADVVSDLANRAVRVQGQVYPRADASFAVDQVTGTLRGELPGDVTVQAGGRFEGRAVSVQGTLGSERVRLTGEIAEAQLNVQADRSGGKWTGALRVLVADLRELTGQPGQLSGELSGTLAQASGEVSGAASGVTFRLPVRWRAGALRIEDGEVASQQLGARVTGQAYPKLNLNANVDLRQWLPGQYTVRAAGSLNQPDLRASGTLRAPAGSAQTFSLDAAGTRLDARLLGQDWRVEASGSALQGAARGHLTQGVLTAQFELASSVRWSDGQLALHGPFGWNARTGWQGNLRASGRAYGQDTNVVATGKGVLTVAGSVGRGQIQAALPPGLPGRPGGTLRLETFDLGALWGRSGQLTVTGEASLGGAWRDLQVTAQGDVTDRGGDLSGRLQAQYAGTRGELSFDGWLDKVSAQASWRDGAYRGQLQTRDLRLARLLPSNFEVSELRLGGALSFSGDRRGLTQVRAQALDVQGRHVRTGSFSARGELSYSPSTLSSDLTVRALGGELSAVGAFPREVRMVARGVQAAALGVVSADLTLSGQAGDPALSGLVISERPEVTTRAQLRGRLLDPAAQITADFIAPYRGQLSGELAELTLDPPGARVRLTGSVGRGEEQVTLDLAGRWPQLQGEASAGFAALGAPVRLVGNGRGQYTIDAGVLGSGQFALSGFVPQLSGSARLTPLSLLDARGSGALDLRFSGSLSDPQVALSGGFRQVERSGVRLGDLSLSGAGTLRQWSVQARQHERTVATFDGRQLTVEGLAAEAFSSRFTADGSFTPGGGLQATVRAEGALSGSLRLGYTGGAASASGTIRTSGANATFEVAGSEAVGWNGRGRVGGLPAQVITRDPIFTVEGAWDTPSLAAQLGVFGAAAQLRADSNGARLALDDGPGTQADGELRLTGQALSGAVSLMREGARVNLSLGGTLNGPSASVDAAYGGWRARGSLSRQEGRIIVSDGARDGTVQLSASQVRVDLPGLDLGQLGVDEIGGTLVANGQYDLSSRAGRVSASVSAARTPYSLPVVDVPVAGLVQLNAIFAEGETRVNGMLSGPNGRLGLDAVRRQEWSGQVSADLRRTRGNETGTLRADLGLAGGRLNGTLNAANYPLTLLGRAAALRGALSVRDNEFELDAGVSSTFGRLTFSGGGDFAGALEENLSTLQLGLQPSGEGYRVDARLEGLDLQALQIAELLQGRASGTATLSDGGSTFVLRVPDLRVAGEDLPVRLEGTSFGTEWRVRGFAGDSQLFGSVTGGVLNGRLQLTTLPVGAILSALSGPLPGQSTVSGLARFTLPLADPLAGRIDVVAERIRVSAGNESLTGTGTLAYTARELRNVDIRLRGAGEVDVQGEFSRARVDLRATVRNTSFTPFLAIVPGVRGAQPTLRGDLQARVAGTYEVPEARLTGGALSGSASNVRFTLSGLNASLSSGQLQANTSLRLEGDVAAGGVITASGQLAQGQLSGARLRYDGDLATRQSGRLQRVVAEVLQAGSGWNLDATVVQGGTARITGSLSPQLQLTASARGLTPKLGIVYARDSLLNGDLTIEQNGQNFEVDGALTFERLVIGRVATPSGITLPGTGDKGRNGDNFISPLPSELVTFPPVPGEQRSNPLLSRIVLRDIPVLMPNGIRIDENLARAELTGSLILGGRASEPQVSGQIRVVRGSLFLRENEFAIAEGSATFDGASAYPTFRASAQGLVPDENLRVGVNVNVEGSFPAGDGGERNLDLRTTFSCTQNCTRAGRELTESELYALVALGSANASNLPSELTQSALRTTLNVFLLGEIERGVGRALGLDVFRIRTNLLSGASDFQVQFTLGSYVTRDFYLEYQVDLRGEGLVNATYNTPDNRFTFTVSSPVSGLNLTTLQPSLAVAYNFTPRSSVQFGVSSGLSTTFRLGYTFRF
ncbi:hypothetical protein Deipe_3733 [Deinococcus peraridilitoris DSM 19664]|uniref:Translocation and assembly module TamB C-terminal domain-containing protein n=2 Tax=Deinococcus TaxID=1298 RepID=L0A6U9_DEIPD|nr:hypothetical protein Deipe_3733 [Deinococcus peraridilitoris DSM 19664]